MRYNGVMPMKNNHQYQRIEGIPERDLTLVRQIQPNYSLLVLFTDVDSMALCSLRNRKIINIGENESNFCLLRASKMVCDLALLPLRV
jgi:hypothetical protein